MKPDIHPNYRPVVFQDVGAEFAFLTKSTIATSETIDWEDGETYPLYKVDISSASHPFYTGTMRIIDTAGRVERFERRFGRRKGAAPTTDEAAPETAPKAEAAPVVEAPVAEAAPVEAAPAEATEAPAETEATSEES